MDVFERFRSVFSQCKIQLAISYPLCNMEKEILFLYEPRNVRDDSFAVRSIRHVFLRDNSSGEITGIDCNEIMSEEELSDLVNDVIIPTVFDEEAMDLEDQYYDLYEEYYNSITVNTVSEESQKMKERLNQLLCSMIPESELRNFYFRLEEKYLS